MQAILIPSDPWPHRQSTIPLVDSGLEVMVQTVCLSSIRLATGGGFLSGELPAPKA